MPGSDRSRGGASDDGLRVALAGPPVPGDVEPGGAVRLAVDVSLAAGAVRALIVTVEPLAPAVRASARPVRALVQPGETRTVDLEVALPADAAPGATRVVVRAFAGGESARAATTVGVRPADGAPSFEEAWAAADAGFDEQWAAAEPPPRRPVARQPEPVRPEPVAPVVEPPAVVGPPAVAAAPPRSHRAAEPARRRPIGNAALVSLVFGGFLLVVAVTVAAALLLRDDDGSTTGTTGSDAGPAATAPGPAPEVVEPGDDAPDLGDVVEVTGSVDLDGVDPTAITVSVTLRTDDGPVALTSPVDAEGRYRLELPAGIHRIVAVAPGFLETPQTVVVEDAPVEAQRITLTPA